MTVLIIAEAGVNHNGDLNTACRLVDAAAAAGADLVKFQTFSADRLVTMDARKAAYQARAADSEETQHAMLSRLELGHAEHEAIVDHCRHRGIGFFSTAFDLHSIDYLAGLKMDRFKIPSGELTNLPYIRHIARLGKPVIMSTGMATLGEIESSLGALIAAGMRRDSITVLHCSTEYPTPMAAVNLRAMLAIKSAFNVEVGYSDHTSGIEIAIAAVALGATVLEKHLTLDRTMIGPDHGASLEPDEFRRMVAAIRNVESALGDGIKRPMIGEVRNIPAARKSLVAAKEIRAGEVFGPDNVTAKRPGTGLSPMRWDEVMGRRASRDFAPDEPLEL